MSVVGAIDSLSSALSYLWPTSHAPRLGDHGLVQAIKERADTYRGVTDQVIAEHTKQLQGSVQSGAAPTSKDVLITGSALVSESVRRVLGISYYDVQLLAGIALARGTIAEMQTGEGKTFVSALPALIHGLTGKGVHVLTVNDYLSQRDYELMAPVFHLLGMSIGTLQPSSKPDEKRQAYACDVTYGPGYEFGFDYLRDQAALLAQRKPRLGERYRDQLHGRRSTPLQSLQRGFAFCVIDEVDSVLIDEATTPLLLSDGGSLQADTAAYMFAKQTADGLTEHQDYVNSSAAQPVTLTKQGIQKISDNGHRAARDGLLRPWAVYVRHALHAKLRLKKDVDYVVKDDKIVLVDKNTGRIFADRSWRDGLHQAVEVKEEIPITSEQRPLGHITRQRFFPLYDGKCGMTGTATGNEAELQHFYRLPVFVIPTRKPSQRKHLPTRYFTDQESKFAAVTAEIAKIHSTGQPVLVGTQTIEISELLAEQLSAKHVFFRLLNGKQDESEAQIVSRAGTEGAITIATNIAGRGTDIALGTGVSDLGGLHVIATEHHESMRVDRQLIGRAARQGDPGSCQFFVSADDQLIASHAPSLSQRMRESTADHGEVCIDFSREVAKVQLHVERLRFTEREQMFAHDQWYEKVMSTLAEER